MLAVVGRARWARRAALSALPRVLADVEAPLDAIRRVQAERCPLWSADKTRQLAGGWVDVDGRRGGLRARALPAEEGDVASAGWTTAPFEFRLASVRGLSTGRGIHATPVKVPGQEIEEEAEARGERAGVRAGEGDEDEWAGDGGRTGAAKGASERAGERAGEREEEGAGGRVSERAEGAPPGAAEARGTPPASPQPPPPSWIDSSAPAWSRPYLHLARVDKPIGSWLLALPCFWSIALAAAPGHAPSATMLGLFGAGAILLRGAGCTVNDMWDRDLDGKVQRTRARPLAAGDVTMAGASAFLVAQLLAGLGILVQLPPTAQLLGVLALPIAGLYPLAKRVTGAPQLVLGLAFNWGALMGWAGATGSLDLPTTLPLYAAGVAWTLVYDTIYAHQDKRDDARIGVRSTALTWGSHNRLVMGGCTALFALGLATSGLQAGCWGPHYLGASLATLALARQVATTDLDDPAACGRAFRANLNIGALVFAGTVLDRLLA